MSTYSPSEFVIREKGALWFDRANRVAQGGRCWYGRRPIDSPGDWSRR